MGGFNWHFALLPTASMFFVTPTLLWLAVVSGPEFRLVFGESKPAIPPPAPTAMPTKASALLDPEGYGIEALNARLVSTESYARSSFRWSMFSLITGIAFGLVEVTLSSGLFKAHMDHSQTTVVMILSGTMSLLSALLLLWSMIYSRRASAIQDKLLEMQKVLAAIRFLETAKTPISVDPAMVVNRLMAS
jgi:hypothetical protein